jgi:hypothetical protein
MDAVEAEVSARAAREILESFQNNPEIMGGDPMFTDEAGRPCIAADSDRTPRSKLDGGNRRQVLGSLD